MEINLQQKYNLEFTDFVKQRIIDKLNITSNQYKQLVFDAGIKFLELSKYNSDYSKTKVFWDCFIHQIKFVNLQIIVEEEFLNNNSSFTAGIIDKYLYFELISKAHKLPDAEIKLIHKQYRLQFEKTKKQETNALKQQKNKSVKRVTKSKKDQLQINLNTI